MRVGILASHPIQYQAPWFRALAKETDLHVFFAHRQSAAEQGKAGFGVPFDWDVDLLSGYAHTFLPNIARNPSVNRFSGCDTPQIAVEIANGKFDGFIVNGWALKSYWQAVWACRRNKVPLLVRGDSQLETPRSRILESGKEIIYRVMLRWFDGFLTVGKRNRDYLAHYGVLEKKMFSAPHFVDNERFEKQANEIRNSKFEIRKRWRIPEDAFCVLFCGKFIPKKRPLDLIAAVRELITSNQLSNIHLLFVGSGELGSQLRAECNVVFDQESPSLTSDLRPATSGTRPAASFAGFLNQTEISKAYVAADVLVLPSDGRETWGLVVNEAMASWLPAIVSDAVGCAPDLIEEGRTGFAFPLGGDALLAERLVRRLQMKRDGHDFAPALAGKMETYSLSAAVHGTLRALQNFARSEI
jgi:glycosyltransferase involved in cell wall biosynthesis